MVQSSLHASKGIGTVFIIVVQLLIVIHAGVITKRNTPATTNIALMGSDLFDVTEAETETNAAAITEAFSNSATKKQSAKESTTEIDYNRDLHEITATATHFPLVSTDTDRLLVSAMTLIAMKSENREQISATKNQSEETTSTTIMAISDESTMYSEIDEVAGMATTGTSPQSSRQVMASFEEEQRNNVSSTDRNKSVAVTHESHALNSAEPNSTKDGYQTTMATISKFYSTQSSKISTNDIDVTTTRSLENSTNYDHVEPSKLTVKTNSVNSNIYSTHIVPTASTTLPGPVDLFPLTTPMYAVHNVLEEFNEIIATTSTKPAASEKKAKFLHDNSTNTNKLNLPDASEVWTLVGMKAVPSKTPQPLAASVLYQKQKSVDSSVNNSITNSKEKNLLDWKQIMMNEDFGDKTASNFIENNSVAGKSESEVTSETYPNTFATISSRTNITSTQISPSVYAKRRDSYGEMLDYKSFLVPAATNFKQVPINFNSTKEAAALAKATTTTAREDSLNSSSLSHAVDRETNLVIEENSPTTKTGENIRSVSQAPPTQQLSPLGLTSENSFNTELNIVTSSSTKTIDADDSAINSATEVSTTTTETTAKIPEYVQNVTVRQPLPEHNVSTVTVFQSPPPPAAAAAASRNNSYNELTLKTMNNNYGSDAFERTKANANANDVGEEATLDLHSSTETTTLSSAETSTVSTIAYNTVVYNDDLDIITLAGVTNLAAKATTTQSIITTTAVPKNLENLTSPPNTLAVISKKVHEISTDLDTAERILPTSSRTTQTYLATELNTSKATTEATATIATTATTPSAGEEKEETLMTTVTTLATIDQVLQETSTESSRSDSVTTTTTTTIFPISQSTTAFDDNDNAFSTDTTRAATTEGATNISSDMDFTDNPLYKTTTTRTNSELTEEANYVEPLLPTSTALETHTVSTTSAKAAPIPTTHSSIELEDLTTTTTTKPTTITAVMSSSFTDSTLELITPTSEASRDTVTSRPSTTVTVPKLEEAGPTSTSTVDSILPITLETRTTHKLGVAIDDDPLLHHRDSVDQPRPEMDVNVIIAISVSVIGIIALVLLVGFLYVVRKRQKQMSYGHRCRPVSLDAYSLDNVSVYNSVRRKNAARSSKRSYGNVAFDDPALRHNNLNASELSKFAERKLTIFEEFKYVPQINARPDEVPAGCEDKNRYANVIPIPETRVSLQQQNNDEKTEYINANYVRGPKDSPNYYIACQAPLESTVVDFWRMIWEQKSRVIIQATDLVENGIEKCAEYLPPSVTLDNHTSFGDYQITLKNREVKDKYAISTIILKHSVENVSRELTHYWYRWPETGVPSEEAPIIAMLLEARSSLKFYAAELANEMREKSATMQLVDKKSSLQDICAENGGGGGTFGNGNGETDLNLSSDHLKTAASAQGPLTVHCSPGTGRTGTIIACDIAVRSLETPKRSVDIPQIVYYVRRGRGSAVQTKEQYEFIYKIANMYATKITNVSTDN